MNLNLLIKRACWRVKLVLDFNLMKIYNSLLKMLTRVSLKISPVKKMINTTKDNYFSPTKKKKIKLIRYGFKPKPVKNIQRLSWIQMFLYLIKKHVFIIIIINVVISSFIRKLNDEWRTLTLTFKTSTWNYNDNNNNINIIFLTKHSKA